MNSLQKQQPVRERVTPDLIIVNGEGAFPRRLIIIEAKRELEYRLVKTRAGKFQLNK